MPSQHLATHERKSPLTITMTRPTTYDSEGYPTSFGAAAQGESPRDPSGPDSPAPTARTSHQSPQATNAQSTTNRPAERVSISAADRQGRSPHPVSPPSGPISIPNLPAPAPPLPPYVNTHRGEYHLSLRVGHPPPPSIPARQRHRFDLSSARHNPFLHPRGVESPAESRAPSRTATPALSEDDNPDTRMMFPLELEGEDREMYDRRGWYKGGEGKDGDEKEKKA